MPFDGIIRCPKPMPHQVTGAAFLAARGFALLADEPGLGKAQPLTAKVATPLGWQPIGNLRRGDYVIGSNGYPVRVLNVFPRGKLGTWTVKFSDGAETRCCSDHLWAVNSHNRLTRGCNDWVVKPLKDIINPRDIRIKDAIKESGGRRRWQVPLTKPVQFNVGEYLKLPLDPYVLGCLLGDGHTKRSSVSLCKPDRDMHEEVQRRLNKKFSLTYRFEHEESVERCLTMHIHGDEALPGKRINPVLDVLRAMGIQGCGSFDKFVPNAYFIAPVQDRLDLLRGLLDTDGTAAPTVVFGSRSERLADAVLYLVRSLGGVGYKNAAEKVGAMFYQITIAMPPDMNPFFIKRKADAWIPRSKYLPAKAIDSIEPFGVEECVCIQVDAEDGLYVTDDFIVTHNTATAVVAADLCGARKILVACPGAVRAHWAREFALWQDIDRPIRIADGFLDFVPSDGVTIVSHACLADEPNSRSKRNVGKSIPNIQAGAPYDAIVIDESHYFRAYDALRTRNLWAPAPAGLWAWTTRIWCLSGTPMVNSPADFWPLAYGPLRMPVAWWDWGMRFAEQKVDASGVIKFTGLRNADELAGILRPHMLRRTLTGLGIELPSLTVSETRMPIAADALTRCMAALDGWNPQRLAAALEDKDELHDAALASVRRALGMAKADAIGSHVDQILRSGNGPVVVFFQHTAVRDRLFTALSPSWKVSWIDGKITPAQLGAAESWFQGGKLDVLLVQTDAGGVGISLTRANRCIIAELPWTSVGLWQAIKRIHRIGQSKSCLAEVVRASGCWLEDALASAINRKHQSAQTLFGLLESYQ